MPDRYGLAPADDVLYWRTRDGRNTFPARVERLRRLFDTAASCGVRVDFEGRVSAVSMASYFDSFLERYRHWEESRTGRRA
jgi:pyruvate carboxylase